MTAPGERLVAEQTALARQVAREEIARVIDQLEAGGGPALLPRRDAAAYLGISGSQLDRLYDTGELDVVHGVGRGRLYTRESLDKFWRCRTESNAPTDGIRRLAG